MRRRSRRYSRCTLRADIGVGDDRRAALELAIFLRSARARPRRRAGDSRASQDRLGPRLVLGVAVAMEEAGCATASTPSARELVAEPLDLARRRAGARPRRRRVTRSLHLEAQRALDQRLVLLEEEIVGIGPVDAADLVDVAKALGDEQRGLGAGALEDGIDGDGRAVQEQPDRAIVASPALATPALMPSTRWAGVDSALPKESLPVASSKTAMSVKVPPISAARRRPAATSSGNAGVLSQGGRHYADGAAFCKPPYRRIARQCSIGRWRRTAVPRPGAWAGWSWRRSCAPPTVTVQSSRLPT